MAGLSGYQRGLGKDDHEPPPIPIVVEPGAIPWLLLKVVGSEDGPTGGDRLTATTYIQRVNTIGGLAHQQTAVPPRTWAQRQFVPYEADYIFYKATRRE